MPEPLLHAVSVSAALAGALRARILDGEISPGTPLPEAEIGATYGVARPTVRAAIQDLVSLGLLRREANRSAYVPKLAGDEIADLYFARLRLESDAVRILAERVARPAAAEDAVRELESFDRSADWSDIVEADLAFHRALIAGVGSARLARLYDLLQDEMRLALAQLRPAYDTPAALAAEHRALLEAVAEGDGARATALLHEHLADAVAALTAEEDE